ncbi:MAG: transporter substrate-binding domain-containing protein [Gammaproteobacteria bacterium]|jgi:hypothetical protein|nr:transporter substrate-binding domain-containing protein [Gammaproteobacteria bacterium]MBU2427011.1 transporter substrate-binding domain-containing protein [Gammaproteobacteria bacterium]
MATHHGWIYSLCLASCSLFTAAEPVTYFYSHLPPFEFTAPNGAPAGVGIEKVRNVLTEAGFTPEFKFYSLQRGLNALHTDIDFTAIVLPSAEEKQQFRTSQYPIYAVGLGVVRLNSTPPLSALSQLPNHAYVALSETKFTYLNRRPSLTDLEKNRYEVNSYQDAFRLILKGKYLYFLSYQLTSAELTNPAFVFDLLEQQPVHLMLSHQHPDADRLMQRIDTVLAEQQAKPAH